MNLIQYPTVTITPVSPESTNVFVSSSSLGSSTWPSTNRAIFMPFRIWTPITVVKMFCINGTVVSGNVDVGIYSIDGTRLVSAGSTAQAGTSVIQEFDITNTKLGVGLFYMGMAVDNTTAALYRRNTSREYSKASGMVQMSSAFPLPATATFAQLGSSYIPFIGLTTRSVI